jgi:dolichol-phosphate mannosyltransferase
VPGLEGKISCVSNASEQVPRVEDLRIAVVIPCFRVVANIADVLARIRPGVDAVYCVDDACPDGSGRYIESFCQDERVVVLRNEVNRGVGGATLAGLVQAFQDGASVAVKVDGDGQMDPALVEHFANPILAGRADFTKGNRFFHPTSARDMPLRRMIGNGVLSFLTKFSTGYWDIFDPTNGYLASTPGFSSRSGSKT